MSKILFARTHERSILILILILREREDIHKTLSELLVFICPSTFTRF